MKKFKSLKEEYTELLSSKITVSIEDLLENEKKLIEESFVLFKYKLEEIKVLNDEIKRLQIKLLNLKAMRD